MDPGPGGAPYSDGDSILVMLVAGVTQVDDVLVLGEHGLHLLYLLHGP